eukprot:4587485-Prymnesium_polylepis.1
MTTRRGAAGGTRRTRTARTGCRARLRCTFSCGWWWRDSWSWVPGDGDGGESEVASGNAALLTTQ